MEYKDIYEIGSVWQSLTSATIVKIEKVENNNIWYTVTSGNLDTRMKMPVEYFTKKFVRIDVPSDYNPNVDLTKSYLSHPISDAISSMVDFVACEQHLYSAKHLPNNEKDSAKSEEEKEVIVKRGSLWVVDKTTTVKVSNIQLMDGKNHVYYSEIESGIDHAEPEDDFIARFEPLKDNDLGAIYEKRDDPTEWVHVVLFSPDSTCVHYHYYGGKFNGRDDENDITSFHKQYKLITFYPTDLELEHMHLRGIPNVATKECDITTGSIWREVRGCDQRDIGRTIKVTGIVGDLIEWKYTIPEEWDENNSEGCTCKSSFLYCFERFSHRVTTPSEVTWPGAIWYHKYGGVHIAITIKEENGTVSYVSSDNKVLDLYWKMPFEEWAETYRLYDGVNPPCFPEGSFDEMLEETKGRYERVMEKLKEEEKIKADKKETYLNTDESKMKEFSTGAKREDKSGKGRYDLIPGDAMRAVIEKAEHHLNADGGFITIASQYVNHTAYFEDVNDVSNYCDHIINIIANYFAPINNWEEACSRPDGTFKVSRDEFYKGMYEMRKKLADHYEAGAKIHGADNWKKGIPLCGGERGGTFVDSMRRHTDQALMGKIDEPHAVAAIWNALGAIWTIMNGGMIKEEGSLKFEVIKDRKQPDPTDVNSIRYDVDDVHVCAIWRSLIQGDIYINWDDVKRWLSTCDGSKEYFMLLGDCASPVIKSEIMREIAIKFMSYALDNMRYHLLAYLEKRRFRENSPVHGFIMALINLNTYARYNMFAFDNNIGKVLADLIDAEFNLVDKHVFSADECECALLAMYDPTENNKSGSMMNFNNKMIKKFAESARRFNTLAGDKLRGYGFESCLQRLIDAIPMIP